MKQYAVAYVTLYYDSNGICARAAIDIINIKEIEKPSNLK